MTLNIFHQIPSDLFFHEILTFSHLVDLQRWSKLSSELYLTYKQRLGEEYFDIEHCLQCINDDNANLLHELLDVSKDNLMILREEIEMLSSAHLAIRVAKMLLATKTRNTCSFRNGSPLFFLELGDLETFICQRFNILVDDMLDGHIELIEKDLLEEWLEFTSNSPCCRDFMKSLSKRAIEETGRKYLLSLVKDAQNYVFPIYKLIFFGIEQILGNQLDTIKDFYLYLEWLRGISDDIEIYNDLDIRRHLFLNKEVRVNIQELLISDSKGECSDGCIETFFSEYIREEQLQLFDKYLFVEDSSGLMLIRHLLCNRLWEDLYKVLRRPGILQYHNLNEIVSYCYLSRECSSEVYKILEDVGIF